MPSPDEREAGLPGLLASNRAWARARTERDPEFFKRLSEGQQPRFLWIGCSDSRLPANEIVGAAPGELFVHRNVANIVSHDDTNCLAVIHYALDVLHVEHIIVTGHYNCGGVNAVLDGIPDETLDNWLWPIQRLYDEHKEAIDALPDRRSRAERLCELNVMAQVRSVASLHVVRKKWREEKPLYLHGWIYQVSDGILRDLGVDGRIRK